MGAAASSNSPSRDVSASWAPTAPTSAAPPSPSDSLAALARSGRYALLRSGSGAAVHVLGVYPCSTGSASEAVALVAAVRPALVYVGLHPELAAVLEADVRAGRMLDAGWRIPERAPDMRFYDGAGWIASVVLRNLLADNEMLGLLGCEALLPFKAAIRAALRLPGGGGGGGGGDGGGGSNGGSPRSPASGAPTQAPTPPARLLTFPLGASYNNLETLDQPAQLQHVIIGNAAQGSTAVTALVGNPSTWLVDAQEAAAHAQAVQARAADAALPDPGPAPPAPAPEVNFVLELPAEGYFTRDEVRRRQADFRQLANDACLRASIASADLEGDMVAREQRARERAQTLGGLGDAAAAQQWVAQAESWHARQQLSQRQSQAAAFHLQSALDELAAVAAADRAPPPEAVAIVSLGAVASLTRNWGEPLPPHEAFPPHSPLQLAVGNGVPAAGGAALLYGTYRLFRRLPRLTGAVVLSAGLGVGALVYSSVHSDWTRYGTNVRSALAKPKVTTALARVNR